MIKTLFSILLATGILAGCATNAPKVSEGPAGFDPNLEGKTFIWAKGITEKAHLSPTIKFEDGRVTGFAGCNSFTGTYVLEGKAFKVTHLGSTMKMCSPEVATSENEFLTMLALTRFVTEDAGAVYLWDKSGVGLMMLTAPKDKQ